MLKREELNLLKGRLEDLSRLAVKRRSFSTSEFLDMAEGSIADKWLTQEHLAHKMWGGYEDAERRIAIMFPDKINRTLPENLPITYLQITPKKNPYVRQPNHRDYLGALMNLGIERRVLGDFLMTDEGCVVICITHIADYLLTNFTRVGNCDILVSEIEGVDQLVGERQYKRLRTTVSSMRIDSIVKATAKLSRGDSLSLIKSGKVFINGFEVTKGSQAISEGDVISVRGHGKYKVALIGNRTKKDRLVVEIDQYI